MRLLLISSSRVHGFGYLDHSEQEIRAFLGPSKRVAFIPFAFADHDAYTKTVRDRFALMGFEVTQVKTRVDLAADAIFVGGGNTFRLLKTLYDRGLLDEIKARVRTGMPYMGSSAGTVIAGPTMKTTN